MKYTFKDILTAEIYENTRVMIVLGNYVWFNNMVCDTLKGICMDQENVFTETIGIGDEFGITDGPEGISNSVDFSTFMNVIGVASINGRWYCRTDYSMLNKKQKEQLIKYAKEPSENGILVITSNDWMQYKDLLKLKMFNFNKYSHIMQLGWPTKPILKNIITQYFDEKGISIEPSAADFFILKMSQAYDKYEEELTDIVDIHKQETLTVKDLKEYMKGIENYVLDDFIAEIVKPMSSDKTNSKKVLKIMMALEDELTPKDLVYKTLKKIDEFIEYRILINKGYIPIGINYFFNDVLDKLPNKEKYEKVNEWTFRKKAEMASRTSLRDWEYMKLILTEAIADVRISEDEMSEKCQKALYELCTRSAITPSRINNIIGIDNVLSKGMSNINKIQYNEELLNKILEESEYIDKEDIDDIDNIDTDEEDED